MRLIPVNRQLLVEPVEEKLSDLIEIPDSAREELSPFTIVNLLDCAEDCEKITPLGECDGIRLVVQTHGIETVKTLRETFHIVSENFVVGILED